MILSDRDIRRRLEEGDLEIDPLEDPELQIQPASVDLRLGREFLEFEARSIGTIDPERGNDLSQYVRQTSVPDGSSRTAPLDEFDDDETTRTRPPENYVLHPGNFVLGTTKERVGIPDDLIAHVEGRSSLGRLAIVVHASLPGDEEVFLWTPTDGFGHYPIGSIVEEERPAWAVAFDPRTLRVSTYRVTDYLTNPRKSISRVELASGRSVHVTKDHNLFTLDATGGVTRLPSEDALNELVMIPGRIPTSPSEAIDLIKGRDDGGSPNSDATSSPSVGRDSGGSIPLSAEPLGSPETATHHATTELTPAVGHVLGAVLARGRLRGDRIEVTLTRTVDAESVAACAKSLSGATVSRFGSRLIISHLALMSLFVDTCAGARITRVPDAVWDWPTPIIASLCSAFEAYHQSRSGKPPIPQSLASDLTYLAGRIGECRSVLGETAPTDTRVLNTIPAPGSLFTERRAQANLSVDTLAEDADVAPTLLEEIESRERQPIAREKFANLVDTLRSHGVETPRLEQLLRGDVRFDRVVAVEDTGRVEETYDLEVQPHGRVIENFLGGRGGVFLSNTAGLCDPGYEGQITLELSNLGTAPVALTPGMRIAQLTFTELTSPAERPYGAERGSKYQGQEGPQASRIERDPEFDRTD